MNGRTVWITGLSGAGKSTVAALVAAELKRRTPAVVLLDGDALREVFPRADGMTKADRLRLATSYARLCGQLASQGLDVVIATISMFDEVRAWNREHLARYVEVFLDVPKTELRRRDPKGLYARFDAGEAKDVVGFDLPAELPTSPHLRLENHGDLGPQQAAAEIIRWLDAHQHG